MTALIAYAAIPQLKHPVTSASTSSSLGLNSTSANSVALNLVKMINVSGNTNGPGMAYDPFNGYLYVVNGTNAISITVIDTSDDSIIANIHNTNASGGLLYDPWNHDIYAGQDCGSYPFNNQLYLGDTLLVLQGTRIVKDIYGPCTSGSLAYDPSTHEIFLTANSNDNPVINVIKDTDNSIITTINTADTGSINYPPPTGSIAYDSGDNLVYVAAGGDVLMVNPDTNGIVGSIQISFPDSYPVQYAVGPLAYNPMNRLVYVSNSQPPGISEVNGTRLVGNLAVYNEGFEGYAADTTRGISFISADPGVVVAGGLNNTELLNATLSDANQIAYDPVDHLLYVLLIIEGANGSTGIAVFNTTKPP